ncbi:hypothetical protein GSI_00011 [Ganoderma sinense ZZ0214-1]|uniref:DUF6532 domain-containing protein n=1 Tax=Ganoderma sinense ZZ0214-1 TaxID=1077348 RepID=A0A2G8SRH8_9APHY|nr:hypothetical protein GSI_00011 [Ganoderma sinense ZZ0214-1]
MPDITYRTSYLEQGTYACSVTPTVINDDYGQDMSSGEEEGSDADAPRDDDDQSESGDDPVLDDGGDDLEAHLAAERPIWQERDSSVPGKGKARAATTPAIKSTLLPADFDNSSGSEFEPFEDEDEDEDDTEEDELDEELGAGKVEVGRERRTVGSVASSTHPKKVKVLSKAQLARQQLETPTWKPSTSIVSMIPANTNCPSQCASQAGNPDPASRSAVSIMPSLTPTSVDSDVRPADGGEVLHVEASDHDGEHHDDDNDDDNTAPSPPVIDLVSNPPADYFVLVFPPGGGPLNISPQQSPVQAVLHGANATVIKNVVFENAFPDSFGRCKFVADALFEGAIVHDYTGLLERLKTDPPFLHSMSGVAKQHISNFRGTIKKAAEGFVHGFYGVGGLPPAECADKVSFMLENLTYVYPFIYEPGKRSVPWHKPYSHPCVLALLTSSFFQGPKSIAAKYPDLFPSSDPDRLREHEIPPSMLALVGVAIHAALAEWKSGVHRAIPFAADSFVDVYNEHMTTINGIKPKNLGGYHTMLHRLYKSASNITPIAEPVPASVSTALDRVDVDAMEVDE